MTSYLKKLATHNGVTPSTGTCMYHIGHFNNLEEKCSLWDSIKIQCIIDELLVRVKFRIFEKANFDSEVQNCSCVHELLTLTSCVTAKALQFDSNDS